MDKVITVAELIEHLKKFPPETRVMREDYEYGRCDLVKARLVKDATHYWDPNTARSFNNEPVTIVGIS